MFNDIPETVVKATELHKLWGAPDNSRLTAKQQSFRLPVHVAAKINALCDLYPHRTKTEIVGDLLARALEEAINGLCYSDARVIYSDRVDGDIVEWPTDEGRLFYATANKHFKALERELGNKKPPELYPARPVASD